MKKSVDDMFDLNVQIKALEAREKSQVAEIKSSAKQLASSLSPKNIIKSAVRNVIASPDVKANALDMAVGAAAGSIGRKIIVGGSGGVIRKITGTAVKFILANFIRNKLPGVKKKLRQARTNGIIQH